MGLLNIFFPPRCPFCGETLGGAQDGICDSCRGALPFIGENICRICGVGKQFCECRKRSYHCTRRVAPLYYEGLGKRGIVRFKKYGHFGGCDALARLTTERIKKEYNGIEFDMVVCVPSSKTSLNERGYNQTALLARKISKLLDIPFNKKVLVRIFDGKPQKGMSRTDRIGNVAGVYDVATPDVITDKNLLLIDDVITTGATINECAKMLRIFGAAHVYGAAVCLAKKKQQS